MLSTLDDLLLHIKEIDVIAHVYDCFMLHMLMLVRESFRVVLRFKFNVAHNDTLRKFLNYSI